MNISLIGNGFEINYQEKLKKQNLIDSILGKNAKKREDSFPHNIYNFAEKCNIEMQKIKFRDSEWDKTGIKYNIFEDKEFKIIKEILTRPQEGKSIEKIYMDVENALPNKEQREKIKELFLSYLDFLSNQIEWSSSEKQKLKRTINDKFDSFDLIFTTNYTHMLENILTPDNSKKIIHIHGEFNNMINPPILGKSKLLNSKHIKLKIIKHILNKMEHLNLKTIDINSISLSVFGWGLDNEYDVPETILIACFVYIKNEEEYITPFGITTKLSQDRIVNNKKNVEIYYYYYLTSTDLENFRNYKQDKIWIKKKNFFLTFEEFSNLYSNHPNGILTSQYASQLYNPGVMNPQLWETRNLLNNKKTRIIEPSLKGWSCKLDECYINELSSEEFLR